MWYCNSWHINDIVGFKDFSSSGIHLKVYQYYIKYSTFPDAILGKVCSRAFKKCSIGKKIENDLDHIYRGDCDPI